MFENSLGGGSEPARVFRADGTRVNFYKLDKTKPYKTVGGNFNASCSPFSQRARERQRIEREVLADCTLTDGVIAELSSRCITTGNGDTKSTYYEVEFIYTFCDTGGNARSGKLETVYGSEPPFFVGQYLMIAFNGADSVVLRKFTLSEGADEFERAEAERCAVDFDCLSGKLLDFNPSKCVVTNAYPRVWLIAGCSFVVLWILSSLLLTTVAIFADWGLPFAVIPAAVTGVFFLLPGIYMAVLGVKRVSKLRKILKSPCFTEGIIYCDKSTYRGNDNPVRYRYKDSEGNCHVENFYGALASQIVDGQTVTVAYRGEESEVVSAVAMRNGRGNSVSK